MSLSDLYPDIRPSLNLDFANTKILDPRISFARNSTASYYDGKTFAKAEENLLRYSQKFDTGWTANGATVTADDTAAPDGTTTADKLVCSVNNAGIVFEDIAPASGQSHTFSAYLKAGTHQYGFLALTRSNSEYYAVSFDLSAGTVEGSGSAGTATATSNSITAVGNGWYRCSITATISGTESSPRNSIGFSQASPSFTTGSSNSDVTVGGTIYIWGAQLEQRDSATAYTPTTDQPITNYIPVLKTAASGEARFDHDPVTGESKGLLIEEQRTNLILNSANPTNPITAAVSVSDSGFTAPTGNNYQRIIELPNASVGKRFFSRNYTANKAITISFYIKNYSGNNYLYFRENTLTGFAFSFSPSLGAFDSSGFAGGASSSNCGFIALPDGGYRVYATLTFTSNANRNFSFDITNSVSNVYAGDGWSGFLISDFQLEEGSFPTSYIKTEGSQVTRIADSASIDANTNGTLLTQDADGDWTTAEKIDGDTLTLSSAKRMYQYPRTLTQTQIDALTGV